MTKSVFIVERDRNRLISPLRNVMLGSTHIHVSQIYIAERSNRVNIAAYASDARVIRKARCVRGGL
jgi:hypothetical protein